MKDLLLNILRYIVAIPLALIGAVVGISLAPYLFVMYIPIGSIAYDITWHITSNIFFVLIPFYILYTVPPKKHIKTLCTIGLIYCIIWVLTIILEIINQTFSWERLINAIIQIVTIILYLLSLPVENKTEIISETN